ncbi:MAG: DUF6893 family small protein [Terriglobia bacterium]
MWKVVQCLTVVAAIAAFISIAPDIKRYLKISAM